MSNTTVLETGEPEGALGLAKLMNGIPVVCQAVSQSYGRRKRVFRTGMQWS